MIEVGDGHAHPVPEESEEGRVPEDVVPPLHPPEGADVFQEADLDTHRRDPRVHQVAVRLGQLPGDDEVPTDEGAHHEEQASDSQAELVAKAQWRHAGMGSDGYKSDAILDRVEKMALKLLIH